MTYVTIISATKFKPEFQKYKARKSNTFYQRKRVKDQYIRKTSFWLHKLVVRTHFRHQKQYVTYVTYKICLISTLPYLTALTPPPFVVLFGFI